MGSSLDAAGISIREQIEAMQHYVMPPQFDFVDNNKMQPVVMYMFEFEYTFDKDDLSYIWQNLAPRRYKTVSFQEDSTSHKLIDTELLSGRNLAENENLRWMVFKVKQRSQADYYDFLNSQVNAASNDRFLNTPKTSADKYLQFNWPYDYLSFVEMTKIDVQILYKDKEVKDKKEDSRPYTKDVPARTTKRSSDRSVPAIEKSKQKRGNNKRLTGDPKDLKTKIVSKIASPANNRRTALNTDSETPETNRRTALNTNRNRYND